MLSVLVLAAIVFLQLICENSFFVVQNLRIAFTKAGFILILVIP